MGRTGPVSIGPDPIREIERLKDLQPGWDSYGADPIADSARATAISFLRRVAELIGWEYARPVVGPTPSGGVALMWRRPGQMKVEVIFAPSGSTYLVSKDRKIRNRGPINHGVVDAVVMNIIKPNVLG